MTDRATGPRIVRGDGTRPAALIAVLAALRADGRGGRAFMYFGSVGGLVSVPKGTPLRLRPPSPVRITGIERLVDGRAVALTPGVIEQRFEIGIDDVMAAEFAVLDFTETAHEYAYRLHAGDPWTPVGRRRQLTFVGMAPGRYAFEVRGRDAFGRWSASVPVDFEVVPPVWMRPWFRGLVIAAVVLLALAAHRVRLRALRTRNAVLERLQSQREQTLAEARRSQAGLEEAYAGLRQLTGRLESAKEDECSRISRELHDEFGQTLTAAKLNLQMLRSTMADPGAVRRLEDAVGNALRHARASVIRVTLREQPDALRLVVEDDGVGFDPAAVSRSARRGEHLGLVGMTERVHNAGGSLELDARPGAGSRIVARIPHEPPRPEGPAGGEGGGLVRFAVRHGLLPPEST